MLVNTLGCSVTNFDEDVRADLVLETLMSKRDFRKLKWYHKITKDFQVDC